MSMDFMEQRLFDLYDKYLYSYDELRKKALAETCYREYSKGGEGTHRGYYCPSPVIDLVIGNVSRGRLLKRRPAVNYDYIYYLNEARQIIMVDDFATWENGSKTLYTREFVFHGENIETSVEYKLDSFLGYIHMYSASLCDYDAGKLRTYQYISFPHSPQRLSQGPFGKLLGAGYFFLYPPVHGPSPPMAPILDFKMLALIRLHLCAYTNVCVDHSCLLFCPFPKQQQKQFHPCDGIKEKAMSVY